MFMSEGRGTRGPGKIMGGGQAGGGQAGGGEAGGGGGQATQVPFLMVMWFG